MFSSDVLRRERSRGFPAGRRLPSLGRRELVDQRVHFEEINRAGVVGCLEHHIGPVIIRAEGIAVEDIDADGLQPLGQLR